MSHRKDLYQATATLAGGALAVATGTPLAGVTTIGVSLAHLIGLGRDRKDADLSAAIHVAIRAAEAALRDSPDFTDADFARAKALIDTAPRSIDPVAFAAAARNGPPEPRIAANLLAAIDFQPDDHAPRRLLELILGQTVATICAHPSMKPAIDRAFDVQNAQAMAVLDAKVNDLTALMLRHLDQTGEAQTARASGITDARIVALAQQVAEDVDDPEQAFRELEATVADAIAYRNAPPLGANADAALADLRTRLEALADSGQLAEAQRQANAALARWEAEEADRQAQATQAGIGYLNEAFRRDLDMRDAEAAAAKLARRVTLETPDPAARFNALRAEQDLWYERGRDKGLRLDLEVAIALARFSRDAAQDADQRSISLNDLGNALLTVGQREAGTDRLEEAVTAYRAALAEWTRDRVPFQWAMTQVNLGTALWTLGQREAGTDRLEAAVTAYRAALEEWTRDRVPLDWAMTQGNLCNVHLAFFDKTGDLARLDAAQTALNGAREVFAQAGASQYLAMAEQQQAAIDARRG